MKFGPNFEGNFKILVKNSKFPLEFGSRGLDFGFLGTSPMDFLKVEAAVAARAWGPKFPTGGRARGRAGDRPEGVHLPESG